MACTGNYKQLCVVGALRDECGEISRARLWRVMYIMVRDRELYLGRQNNTVIKRAF